MGGRLHLQRMTRRLVPRNFPTAKTGLRLTCAGGALPPPVNPLEIAFPAKALDRASAPPAVTMRKSRRGE
jgi:hypothetical protein